MKTSIFKKANSLKDKVIEQGEGRQMFFFSFKDIENPPIVSLKSDGKKLMLNKCDCKHHSIYGGIAPQTLCSYNLAVLAYLVLKNEQ